MRRAHVAVALAVCVGCSTAPGAAEKETAVNVKHSNERTWIEGVAGFNTGQFASSVHGCQARILQALGESLSYGDLVCYSGFAFRIGIHEGLCPSAGHPACGFECLDGSNRALPWKTTSYGSVSTNKPEEHRAARAAQDRAVKDSIDRGVPVQYGSEEDGLIIGYADEGRRWWCLHPYHKNGSEAFWQDEGKGMAGGGPWGIAVWTEPKPTGERVPDRECTLAALRQAVEMWKTETRGAYFVGDAAYGHWLKWLREVDSGKAQNPKAGMQGNGWCYDVLIQNRRIAGRWLKQKADSFPAESAKKLRTAADHYAQVAELCMKDIKCSWDLAPGPNRFDAWTSQLRQQQIARLEAARDHDRAAVEAIAEALAALR